MCVPNCAERFLISDVTLATWSLVVGYNSWLWVQLELSKHLTRLVLTVVLRMMGYDFFVPREHTTYKLFGSALFAFLI